MAYTPTPRSKNPGDIWGLKLETMNKDVGKKATLGWYYPEASDKGEYIIQVYTGNDKDCIKAKVPVRTAQSIFTALEEVARSDDKDTLYSFEIHDYTFSAQRQRSKDRVHVATIRLGKNKHGVVWISAISESNPALGRIVFPFTMAEGTLITGREGKVGPDIESKIGAIAYARQMSKLHTDLVIRNYADSKKDKPSGGGNSYSGSSGGSRAPAGFDDADDDMPY